MACIMMVMQISVVPHSSCLHQCWILQQCQGWSSMPEVSAATRDTWLCSAPLGSIPDCTAASWVDQCPGWNAGGAQPQLQELLVLFSRDNPEGFPGSWSQSSSPHCVPLDVPRMPGRQEHTHQNVLQQLGSEMAGDNFCSS